MNKKIIIKVIGSCGSGKSTISHKIMKLLKSDGIDVVFSSNNDFKSVEEFNRHFERKDSYDLDVSVIVQETQLIRGSDKILDGMFKQIKRNNEIDEIIRDET